MAEYGNREIGIIQDALKEIYDELINGGASEFRQQILNTLLQGRPDNYYTTHINTLEEAFEPLENTFGQLNLSTMMNYAFANLEVLVEMEALDDLTEPAQMWTGYDETSEAVLDIANELNENFDFEIDTNQDIYDVTREMTEQLQGSNIKVQDIPLALDMQIRTLDEMKYFEIGSMYSAWSSTEVMRPFTVQLVEVYNQIENLPEELINELYVDIADSLSLKEGPSDYLRAYDNPNNSQAKAVKNVIKYYLEQLGRQQTGYVNFSSVDNTFYDGGIMMDFYEATDQVATDVGIAIKSNINLFLQNAVEPTQLLNSVKSFQGVTADDFPYQIDKGYMQAYNEIIGTQIINNRGIKDVNATVDYVDRYDLSIEDFAEELDIKIKSTPTNVVDEIKSTMIGYENQVKAFKNLDKNVIGELPVEKNSQLFSQNIRERPDSISYDEFIKNYPVEELGPIPFYEGTGNTLTPDDWLREQNGTGYQLKEGVTPEEFRKSLDNFIEQIDNPHIKEGLLSRYRKYDKLSEGIIDQTVKSRILGAVNQDVFYDVIAFNDDLYTTKKTEDMAIVFDGWTEPTPFEDMALAEMEDWDWVLDEQGNKVEPIDPRKNIQGMDEYDKTLNQYYKYYTEEITDTPTNVVDLDEVISQSDGVDNLNKSKEIMQKNPGFFRKVFNVLEKLDIGDQVITKAIAKGLPALGLASAAPGAAIAYGAYEISILLTDAAQAYNKMQTTDEGFWDNFGELSDKYSIAYKISKPVYDIILDSLNDDLTTEGQDEEILFSFNR
jgi:hypothetical protein